MWTAFITHHIDSPYWVRRVKSRVLLQEAKRVIFFPEYSPPRTSRGEHILKFTSEDGVYFTTYWCFYSLTYIWCRCQRFCWCDWATFNYRLSVELDWRRRWKITNLWHWRVHEWWEYGRQHICLSICVWLMCLLYNDTVGMGLKARVSSLLVISFNVII